MRYTIEKLLLLKSKIFHIKGILTLLLLLGLGWNGFSQNKYSTAHLRSYQFSFNAYGESRIGKILLAPQASAKFMNGRLELGGFYAFQAGNSKELITGYLEHLIGNNVDRKLKSYEAHIGFNFFKLFQKGKTVFLYSKIRGNTKYNFYGPGTRALLGGVRVGCGGFVNSISGYQGPIAPFLLRNSDGVTIPEGGTDNSIYRRPMYTNVIHEYLYAGLRLHYTSKGNKYYQTIRGGSVASISLDILLPTRVDVGKMYGNDGMGYTAIPKAGDNWKAPGYRLVLEGYPTAVFSSYVRIEGGKMPHFNNFLPIPTNYFFNVMAGFHLYPDKGYVEFNKD